MCPGAIIKVAKGGRRHRQGNISQRQGALLACACRPLWQDTRTGSGSIISILGEKRVRERLEAALGLCSA